MRNAYKYLLVVIVMMVVASKKINAQQLRPSQRSFAEITEKANQLRASRYNTISKLNVPVETISGVNEVRKATISGKIIMKGISEKKSIWIGNISQFTTRPSQRRIEVPNKPNSQISLQDN